MVNIVSYNVNGIRSATKKGFFNWLESESIDILCLQEVRAEENQIPKEKIKSLGYFFDLNPAQKRGYSGVAILSKISPNRVTKDTFVSTLEGEGRIIRFDFDQFSVMSLYMPSASNVQRLDFKFEFMH
ncbi:MAG: exodeoxyribonuclease III, partial [Flavobacteriaceae bacterium]|nr:exodeoxyribonuclease III [Flavobacteriaceae bacterium]